MGNVLACCGDSKQKQGYVKDTELGTRTPPSTGSAPTSSRAKQAHRENNWRATGIIGIRDAKLKALPDSIADVGDAARVLDATNNQIKELDARLISQLSNLQRLVFANNLLVTLPPVISSLSNLKLLNLDSNRLTALPAEVVQLSKLEKLSVNGNQLTALPAGMAAMVRLQFLSVKQNQLRELPGDLPAELEEVDASQNQIMSIHVGLSQLQKLKILNLDANHVADVPVEVLMNCAALHTLSLHSNPITPDTLQNNPAFSAFEERRRSKYDKAIAGGVLLGNKGLDEGIDRNV